MRLFITFTTILTIITLLTKSVSAADSTPSATTVIDKLKQIEILKEKIATKVAQLREQEKAGIAGNIKSLTNNNIVLSSKSNSSGEQSISYSDDTIFFIISEGKKGDQLDAAYSKKLKPGDNIAALGYFDTSHTTFAAKYIYIYSPAVHLVGKIIDKDQDKYTITVKKPDGSTLVDIETYTKIYAYGNKALAKSGFSKLKEADSVHIFGNENPKEEDRMSSLKIISLSFGTPTVSTPSAIPTLFEKESSPTAKPKK